MDESISKLPVEYRLKGLDDHIVQGYYKSIVDLAEYFGADISRAKNELLDVVKFEIELAKVIYYFLLQFLTLVAFQTLP